LAINWYIFGRVWRRVMPSSPESSCPRSVYLGVLEPEEEALFFSKISVTDQ
jgi:hypothetical protein